MYFTAGAGAQEKWEPEADKAPGQTLAIDAQSGGVLWSSNHFGTFGPALAGQRLLINDHYDGLRCLDVADGKLLWKGPMKNNGTHGISIGEDYAVLRGYGGFAIRCSLSDGRLMEFHDRQAQLGGANHACGAVALTPNVSINVTVSALHVRDVKTGAQLWDSPGFAPRACTNPSLSNGRVFWPSAASGVLFCWEPGH
jgi:hypothetical protein